jgi:signal transduction histidine kinase
MSIHAILPLLSSILFLIAGINIYLLNKGNERNAFLRFCYVTFHWQFAWFVMFSFGDEQNNTLIARIGYTGIIFIPVTFYESLCAFLNVKSKATKFIYVISVLFVPFLWFTNYFISGCHKYYFGYYPKANFLHLVYLVIVMYVFVNLLFLFRQKLKNEKEKTKRSEIIITCTGLLVYAIALEDYLLNYPLLLEKFNLQLYPLGVFFIIISMSIFLYAHKGKINQQLELQIEERTEELKNSLKALEEIQEEKKRFVSSIAHDLKNPLSVISGYALWLKNKIEPGTQMYRSVENINTSVNQTVRLLDSLLQISLLDSKEIKPDIDIYNYTYFIKEYVQKFEENARIRNIDLTSCVPEIKVVVKVDLQWMERTLGNLIQNAFKYVYDGGKITVKMYTDSDFVYTEVIDTGIGIPEDKIEFIFQRKYQAHKELKKEGYGLGLSIVKEMLEIMGGSISAQSRENVGTTFTYKIPLYTNQNEITKNDTTPANVVPERRSGKDRRLEGRIKELADAIEHDTSIESIKKNYHELEKKRPECKTILLCEDTPAHMRLIVEKLLDKFNLVLAENGKKGWVQLHTYDNKIDLILSDVGMPEMNGIELCTKIKNSEKLKTLPVILMSSFFNDADRVIGTNSGAIDYIDKKISKEELEELLNKHL